MNEVRLGDATEKIGSGATPRGGERVYRSSGVPFVRSQNIYNDGFIPEGLVFIDDQHAEELDYVTVRHGDNLVDITGESVARTCLAPNSLEGARVSQHVAIVRGSPAKVDSRFLHYALVSPAVQSEMLSLAAAGATRQALTKSMIEDLRVPCPPLAEQRAIARVLGSLDDKIELNRRMNQTLEEICRALFKFWFVDFGPVRAKKEGRWKKGQSLPGMSADMWDLWPSEFEDSQLGEIPKGWTVEPMESLCSSIANGGTPRRGEPKYWDGGRISWFKTGELRDAPLVDSEERITEDGLRNSACQLWKPDTILIALYASPTVGRLGLLKTEGTANQACSALIARHEVGYAFLFQTLLSAREALVQIAVGSAQQNISQEVVRNHLVLVPTTQLTSQFQVRAAPLYDEMTLGKQQSSTLSLIRDALLPKLLSGEIRVPLNKAQEANTA
jgi:type I restriction enzyme S subunit